MSAIPCLPSHRCISVTSWTFSSGSLLTAKFDTLPGGPVGTGPEVTGPDEAWVLQDEDFSICPCVGLWLTGQAVRAGRASIALWTANGGGGCSFVPYLKHGLETVPKCFLPSINDKYLLITYLLKFLIGMLQTYIKTHMSLVKSLMYFHQLNTPV